MLLKTKKEESDILTNATMLMKESHLYVLGHDVVERKRTYQY